MKIHNTTIDPFLIICNDVSSNKRCTQVIQPQDYYEAKPSVNIKWTLEIQRQGDGVMLKRESIEPSCIRVELSSCKDSLTCTLSDVFDVNPIFPLEVPAYHLSAVGPCVVRTEGTFSEVGDPALGKLGASQKEIKGLAFTAIWLDTDQYECSTFRVPEGQFDRIHGLIYGIGVQLSQEA